MILIRCDRKGTNGILSITITWSGTYVRMITQVNYVVGGFEDNIGNIIMGVVNYFRNYFRRSRRQR